MIGSLRGRLVREGAAAAACSTSAASATSSRRRCRRSTGCPRVGAEVGCTRTSSCARTRTCCTASRTERRARAVPRPAQGDRASARGSRSRILSGIERRTLHALRRGPGRRGADAHPRRRPQDRRAPARRDARSRSQALAAGCRAGATPTAPARRRRRPRPSAALVALGYKPVEVDAPAAERRPGRRQPPRS